MVMTAVLSIVMTAPTEPPPGATLDVAAASRYELPEQPVKGDTGLNVLLDHAHQATFHMMWSMPVALRDVGFRVVGSHACLDSVLKSRGTSRIRVPVGERRPFAWWPNPRYNVVFTFQHDPAAQAYTAGEIAALKRFVKAGGGLVMSGAFVSSPASRAKYPLERLANAFGSGFTGSSDDLEGRKAAVVRLDEGWTALKRGKGGQPVAAIGSYGKGRVVLIGDPSAVSWDEKAPSESDRSPARVAAELKRVLTLASAGDKPVGGTLRIPMGDEGVGGPIYPETEERVAGAVAYYAKNQFPQVLATIRNEMKKVDELVRAWTPSPTPQDPMFLILAAGGGGGWAVNIYEPKEVGIISSDSNSILSILAHEVAHTCYAGPPNAQGGQAGQLPEVFSEAHAGWFQRKADAWRNGGQSGKFHDANRLFTFDQDGTHLDLSQAGSAPYGQAWTKLWWLWQKLDERYGPTWYPRWLWVKNTRWAAEPSRKLSWDDVVEDMSIACGEDLFPFFRKIGTTLGRDRLKSIEFQGETLELAPAEIALGQCGVPITDKIGDYRKPLKAKA